MEWWTGEQAAAVGPVVGILSGVYGAAIGRLGAMGQKTWAREAMSRMCAVGGGIGVAMLALGLLALVLGQPFHVWFLAGVFGLVSAGVCLPLFFCLPLMARYLERQTAA